MGRFRGPAGSNSIEMGEGSVGGGRGPAFQVGPAGGEDEWTVVVQSSRASLPPWATCVSGFTWLLLAL